MQIFILWYNDGVYREDTRIIGTYTNKETAEAVLRDTAACERSKNPLAYLGRESNYYIYEDYLYDVEISE